MDRIIYDENLIGSFLQDCKLRRFTKHTIQSYKSVLRSFIYFLNKRGKGILEVDRGIFKDYIAYLFDEKNYSYKTVENHFSALFFLYSEIKNNSLFFTKNNYFMIICRFYILQWVWIFS